MNFSFFLIIKAYLSVREQLESGSKDRFELGDGHQIEIQNLLLGNGDVTVGSFGRRRDDIRRQFVVFHQTLRNDIPTVTPRPGLIMRPKRR